MGCGSSLLIMPLNDSNQIQYCYSCGKQNQNLLESNCGHSYHLNCLIEQRLKSKSCDCQKSIGKLSKIDKTAHMFFLKEEVRIIPQLYYQNQKSEQKLQQHQFVFCSGKQCNFFFIYTPQINFNQSKEYFCDVCNRMRLYNTQICQSIDQFEITSQLLTPTQFVSNYQIPKQPQDGYIQLMCGHYWNKNELFQDYSVTLRSVCNYCQQRYSVQVFQNSIISQNVNKTQQNIEYEDTYSKQDFISIYRKQLMRILQATKLTIQFCKNNCGFLYIENNVEDYKNQICSNCEFCYKCQSPLFSNFIKINDCHHFLHLLCAYELINPNKLAELKCFCGQLMNSQTKINLNVVCIICRKYDHFLKLLDCQHYIHFDCFEKNLIKFKFFCCFLCKIPMLNFLSNIDNSLTKKLQEVQTSYELEIFCFICKVQSEENLIEIKCKHKVHQSCFNKKEQESRIADEVLRCLCGQQIN